MTPRPVQRGGGVVLIPGSSRIETPSVLHVRADYGGRLLTAKVPVIHYLLHQLLDDRPRQRSKARSRGSVASTAGRVQRFKDAIA
jgi:hypothetical protein